MKLCGPTQGFEHRRILRARVVDAERFHVDPVIADDRPGMLRPEADGVLFLHDARHETLRGIAPIGVVKNLPRDGQGHGVVRRNVMRAAVHIFTDAGEAELEASLPLRARIGGQRVLHEDIRAYPAAVGPRHVDLAPGGVVLLAKGPHAVLVHIVDQGLAPARDGVQDRLIVVPGIRGMLRGPGHGERVDAILIATNPRFRAETSGVFVEGVQIGLDRCNKTLHEVVRRRPDGPRIFRDRA